MSNAISAFGTKISWNSHEIAEVISISGPGESADTLDVTSHNSANQFREFIAGLRDGGEVSFEANYKSNDTNGQIALHTDFQAGTPHTCLITFPSSAGSITGTAICTKYEFTLPHDGAARISCTLKFTGKPVLA